MKENLGIYVRFYYAVVILGIGLYFCWKNQEIACLRSFWRATNEPWVPLECAASDMSAWLFMSLPGAACLFGYRLFGSLDSDRNLFNWKTLPSFAEFLLLLWRCDYRARIFAAPFSYELSGYSFDLFLDHFGILSLVCGFRIQC